MEKSLHRSIMLITIAISTALSLITYFITKDTMISLGFIIGAVSRLAGLQQIIRMSNRIEGYSKPKATASSNYITRLIFYGVVIWICLTSDINIITLLIGFTSMNIAIVIATYLKNRKERE